jgi:hypothetical protein
MKKAKNILLTPEEIEVIEEYLEITSKIKELQERRQDLAYILKKKFKDRVPFRYKEDYVLKLHNSGIVIPYKRRVLESN